jgi:hypothetical protein
MLVHETPLFVEYEIVLVFGLLIATQVPAPFEAIFETPALFITVVVVVSVVSNSFKCSIERTDKSALDGAVYVPDRKNICVPIVTGEYPDDV